MTLDDNFDDLSLHNRIRELENSIRKHRDQKLDDKCWKDDLELYNKLPEGCSKLNIIPPEKQFLENCKRYCASQQIGSEYKAEYKAYILYNRVDDIMFVTLDRNKVEHTLNSILLTTFIETKLE